jgi:hypothetical protein
MMNTELVDNSWAYVVNMLPADLEESAVAKLAIERKREIVCAEDLLRLCLAYGLCDMPLRQVAAWAEIQGIARLRDTSLLKRLRKCADWLGYVIMRWMQDRGLPTDITTRRVRLVDATVLSKPGSTGTDWRVHMGLDLAQLTISSFELTDAQGAETLLRHSFEPGEIVVGDRGYGHREGVASVLEQDAHTLVRLNWQNFPLVSAAGGAVDIVACLKVLNPGQIGDWAVSFEHDGKSYPMRLVAIGKSDEATEKERKRIRREAKRKGRKPNHKSLQAAGFIFVITDLPPDALPAHEALELYRLRWQIEVFFKRLKSILHIDKVRSSVEQTTRTYVYANILGALIVEELREAALAFFPWGYPLRQQAAERVAALPMLD